MDFAYTFVETTSNITTNGGVVAIPKNQIKPQKEKKELSLSERAWLDAKKKIEEEQKQSESLKLEQQHPNQIIWIIGGPKLIDSCVNILDNVYLTHFRGSNKIDTKIELKSFLTGFTPVRAEVSQDLKSTFVKYAPIFKRSRTSP